MVDFELVSAADWSTTCSLVRVLSVRGDAARLHPRDVRGIAPGVRQSEVFVGRLTERLERPVCREIFLVGIAREAFLTRKKSA